MKSREARIDGALLGGLLLAILLSSLMAFGGQCREVRGQVLRLHILANSDSQEDQTLKLQVRDAVLAAAGDLFAGAQKLEQAEQTAEEHLEIIREAAREEIRCRGYDYPVQVELVQDMYFETRTYDTATLPAGRYDAVRVTIGKAEGRNWWCVLFPPMCVEAAASGPAELTGQIRELGERPDYRIAFAGVELVERLMEKLKGEDPAGEETDQTPSSQTQLSAGGEDSSRE